MLPLAPYELVAHASSAAGVASFEFSVDGELVSSLEVPDSMHGERLAHVREMWTPPGPGQYELSVRATDLQGEPGPLTFVRVRVGELPTSTASPITLPTRAAIASTTPLVTAGACTFVAAANLFCRAGPSQRFEAVDSFTPGQSASVVGESGEFWYVEGPLSGRLCTVPKGEQYGSVSGDCSGLPAFTPMPTPSDTATPTPSPTFERREAPTSTPTFEPPA